jgi:DNA-binding transcriptional LysR family regulator
VSRRIDRLEDSLGRMLFERRKDGYHLTEVGRSALGPLDKMDQAAIALLVEQAAALELAVVKLTAVRGLAEGFLIDRLGQLHREFPGLTLEVIGESRNLSLAKSETDLALRFGPPDDSALVGRRIGWVGFGFYAAPAYLRALAEGAPLQLIGYDRDNEDVPEARWLAGQFPGIRMALRANSQMAQAAAARAGFGIALLPHYIAARDRMLSQADLDISPPRRELWLLRRPDSSASRLVRLVMDRLAALVEQEQDLFA